MSQIAKNGVEISGPIADNCQYLQHDRSFVWGVGFDAKEAYEDAVHQWYMSQEKQPDKDPFPKRPKGIRKADTIWRLLGISSKEQTEDLYVFVGVKTK